MTLFNIQEEELSPMLLLMVFSFFMGTSIAFFFTVSISSFLSSYDSSYLPWSYLLSGITGYILWWIYSKLGLRIQFSGLLVIFLSVLLISVAGLCLLFLYMPSPWLSFVLLVWVTAFMFIKGICFWGTASRVFNIGQAKRIFGVISIGEVISNLIAFFSIPFLLPVVEESGLLIISVASLTVCLFIVFIIIRKNPRALAGKNIDLKRKLAGQKNTNSFKDNYFLLILFFAFVQVFVFYFIDYMFMTLTSTHFPDHESLTSFMGTFMGFVALLELVLKGFVFSKLVKNYGVKSGILTMAVLLFVSTLFAVTTGSSLGAGSTFFAVIALSKLLERSVSSGIFAPSLQILYQPVSPEIRTVFQSKTDGLSSAAGNAAAGLLLIVFQYSGITNLVLYNSLLLALLAVWFLLGLKVYSVYKVRLGEALATRVMKNLKQPVFFSSDYIIRQFRSGNKKISSAAARLIRFADPGIVETTEKPSFSNLDLIESDEKYDDNAEATEKKLLGFHDFLKQGREAEIQDNNSRISYISTLLKSDREAMKLAGIRLAEESKDPNFKQQLIQLLQQNFYPEIVKKTLVQYGDQVVTELEIVFNDTNDLTLKLKIIELWSRTNTTLSREKLLSKINNSSREVWIGAVKALESIRYKTDDKSESLIKEKISSVVNNIVWIHACLADIGKTESRLSQALHAEKNEFISMLYSLLGFIYGHAITDLIKAKFEDSNDLDGVIYALEVMDNFFEPDLKALVLPVFEEKSSSALLQRYTNTFPMEAFRYTDRLVNILYFDYSQVGIWTKACALNECRMIIDVSHIWNEITACLHHSSALMRELSLDILSESNRTDARELVADKQLQNKVKIFSDTEKKPLTTFEKIVEMREVAFFSGVSPSVLACIADKCTEVTYPKSAKVRHEGKSFILLQGNIELYTGAEKIMMVKGKSVIIPGITPMQHVEYFNIETEALLLYCDTDLLTNLIWTDLRQAEAFFKYISYTPKVI